MKRQLSSATLIAVFGFALLSGSLRAQGNFVYTNDDITGPNTVSGFAVDSNGALTPVPGSPFATGGTGGSGNGFFATNRVTVNNVGNFLFASNTGSNDVSVFSINAGTGALSLVTGSPFATGGFGVGIALSATPDGKFLIAANTQPPSVTVFGIASNGALTPIAGSPFPALAVPDGIKVSPDGNFLAAAEPSSNQVEMFGIASSGLLTSLGAFPGGGGALAGVVVDCASSLLYGGEANAVGTIVDGYSIASNGTLVPVPGSPFVQPGVGFSSNVVLLSPDDKTLFVSNQFSNTITVFNVASNGSLSLVVGSPFPMNPGANRPSGMATSKDGSVLYVANIANSSLGIANSISAFSVASNGALAEVGGSPFPTSQPGGLLSLTAFPPKACFLTPQQSTQAIINSVNALFSQGVLNGGQDNSLTNQLQHAIAMMNSGKNSGAIGNVNSFISEVNDLLSSGVLTSSQAASLINAAQSVIAAL